jgi:hypothetical protein
MEKPKFPIWDIIKYGFIFSIVGIVLAFILYLLLGFIGIFTGEKYDFIKFRNTFGFAGFIIPTFIIIWRFFSSKKKYLAYTNANPYNYIKSMSLNELEEEQRLSDMFNAEINKISLMLENSDPIIQDEGTKAYKRLAEKVIKDHKKGLRTGVSPVTIQNFMKQFPEF